jgi:polyhydroxyalkanoate synthesis regulator phasin
MNEQTFPTDPTPDFEGYTSADADTFSEDRWYPGKYTRRFLLAGLGAFATAIDNAGDTFERFADRGERVTQEWRGRVDDVRRENEDAGDRVREYARSGVNAFLDTVGVPNKGDVDTINVKLNILSRKLDEIQMGSVPPAPTGGIVEPPNPEVTS